TSGVRYPIVTAIVSYAGSGGTRTNNGIPANSVPSFQYVDLGIKVKATPHIHGNGDITMTLEATSTALGAGTFNGNPTIDNREFNTQLRLGDGQTLILGGMLT